MKTRFVLSVRFVLLVAVMTAGIVLPLSAATNAWNKVTTGLYNWTDTANWTPNTGFPNAAGDVANVTANVTGYVTNQLNQAVVTVGTLNIGDSDTATRRPYRIVTNAPNQVLVFNNNAIPAQLNQTATSSGDVIAAPVQIASTLTVSSATPDRTLLIDGPISGSSATLTKAGLGELALTAANTFGGLLSVQAGRVVGTAQASGSPFGAATNSVVIGGGDPLVASYVPTLTLTNLTSSSSTTFGDLIAGGSFNSGMIAPNAAVGGSSYLQGEDLWRDAGATLVVVPRATNTLTDTERILFSGSGTAQVNGILPPWLVVSLNNGDFASYGANGIRRATYADTTFNPLSVTQVVSVTNATTLASNQTAYALRLGANLNLNGNTLTLGDGSLGGLILLNGTILSNSTGTASVELGAGELPVYVDSANSATLRAPISGTGTLRKFGSGTLILTNPGLHGGDIGLQAGSLTLSPTADFSYAGKISGAGMLMKDGAATLTWANTTSSLGSLWLRQGTLTLSGATVTNVSALITGPTAAGASPSSTLVLTNGSLCVQLSGGASVGRAANNYVVTNHAVVVAGAHPVSGAKATWDLGSGPLVINSRVNPSTSYSNSVTVGTGGLITNAAAITVGNGSGGTYGRMTIRDGGQVHGVGLTVGASQSFCTADVLNGSLLNVGGASATIGSRGDTLVEGCQLTVDASVMTNVTSVTVGTAGGNAAYPTNNHAVISRGGRLYSTGSATIGIMTASGGSAGAFRNSIRVTGTDSLWNVGGGALSVGPSQQGVSRENLLWVGLGATVTNAGTVWVGYAGANVATDNRLVVTNNGALYSTGAVLIGRANATTAQPRPSDFNGAWVGGDNARWDLGGAALTLGTATLGSGYPTCTATCNWLRVESGGSVSSVGALTVGNGALAVQNRLELAGGSLTAASLALNAGNLLVPIITAQGLTPMTVSGTATLSNGSWIAPSATQDAPAGTYTVLTAASVVNNGVALAPGTDTVKWSLSVTSTAVRLTRRAFATVLIIR